MRCCEGGEGSCYPLPLLVGNIGGEGGLEVTPTPPSMTLGNWNGCCYRSGVQINKSGALIGRQVSPFAARSCALLTRHKRHLIYWRETKWEVSAQMSSSFFLVKESQSHLFLFISAWVAEEFENIICLCEEHLQANIRAYISISNFTLLNNIYSKPELWLQAYNLLPWYRICI